MEFLGVSHEVHQEGTHFPKVLSTAHKKKKIRAFKTSTHIHILTHTFHIRLLNNNDIDRQLQGNYTFFPDVFPTV